MIQRFYRLLLIASFIPFSWIGFMAVHEFGHMLAAWATGGSVSCVVLHPLQISWSAFAPNPHPQVVAWGGPVLGSLLPLGCLATAGAWRLPGLYLYRFFAGFCLVANGLYLLFDSFERGGDAGTLLQHGAARWELLLFAACAVPSGFGLWHGLGSHFGFGATTREVSASATLVSLGLLILICTLELAFSQ